MTTFRRLHRLPSFRDSFGSLLELDDSELRTVVDAVQRIAIDPDAEDMVPEDLGEAYSALAVVRSIAGNEGFDALVQDVRTAYPDSTEAIDTLAPYFSPMEGEIEARTIREVETETLPIIVGGRVSLDYRVSRSSDDKIKLVPLFVARINFDETVAGADAVTFQASAYALAKFRDNINDALALLDTSVKVIDPALLYSPTVKKYQ